MKYNKLVRDNIPKIIKENGGNPKTHIADNAEYWKKLREKLEEEVSEFLESEDKSEIADILEVLDAIYEYKKFDKSDVEGIKSEKANVRGKFKERIILDES